VRLELSHLQVRQTRTEKGRDRRLDTRIALLRSGDRLPVPQNMPLDLTVEQVFGWVRSLK
jgi:hypothetical protein